MTTIAVNRKMMAGDTKVTWDDHVGYRSTKIHRVGGSIFGLRGDSWSNVFLDWVKCGFLPERKPELQDEQFAEADFDVLELSEDGIFVWDKFLTRVEILDDNYAVGSGQKIALYAMRVLKLTPDQAVVEASKIDEFTDRHVTKMDLSNP